MKRFGPIFGLLALGALAEVCPAASILFNNLGSGYQGDSASANNLQYQAQMFTTDAQAYDLTSVVLRLWVSAPGDMGAWILMDNNGAPASLLGPLGQVVLEPIPGGAKWHNATLTSTAKIHLSASASYWVALMPPATSAARYGWGSAAPIAGLPIAHGGPNSPWIADSTHALMMQVNVGPSTVGDPGPGDAQAPEAGTLMLALPFGAVMLFFGRKKHAAFSQLH